MGAALGLGPLPSENGDENDELGCMTETIETERGNETNEGLRDAWSDGRVGARMGEACWRMRRRPERPRPLSWSVTMGERARESNSAAAALASNEKRMRDLSGASAVRRRLPVLRFFGMWRGRASWLELEMGGEVETEFELLLLRASFEGSVAGTVLGALTVMSAVFGESEDVVVLTSSSVLPWWSTLFSEGFVS